MIFLGVVGVAGLAVALLLPSSARRPEQQGAA
jgi:hypothetical protein